MEGRCASCRWWDRVPRQSAWGDCLLMDSGSTPPDAPDRILAVAQDEEDYHAWVAVHRDFGCVMWESKEASDGSGHERPDPGNDQ